MFRRIDSSSPRPSSASSDELPDLEGVDFLSFACPEDFAPPSAPPPLSAKERMEQVRNRIISALGLISEKNAKSYDLVMDTLIPKHFREMHSIRTLMFTNKYPDALIEHSATFAAFIEETQIQKTIQEVKNIYDFAGSKHREIEIVRLLKKQSEIDVFLALGEVTSLEMDSQVKALETIRTALPRCLTSGTENEFRKLKVKIRSRKTIVKRNVEHVKTDSFLNLKKNISVLLRIQELGEREDKVSRPMDEITDEEVLEFIHQEENDKSNKAMAELIKAEEGERLTSDRKGKLAKLTTFGHMKGKSELLEEPGGKQEISLPDHHPIALPQVTYEERIAQYILSLFRRPKIKEHHRVSKRWAIKDLDAIRDFKDSHNDGEIIQRYKDMDDSSLTEQRARHYLPGIEMLISDETDRLLYAFTSDRGVGMMGELFLNGICTPGVIYIGIGEDHVIYHKYFEPLNSTPRSYREFFRDRREFNEAEEVDSDEEDWSVVGGVSPSVSKDGSITFTYSGESHSVKIHPIHEDKLNPHIYP